MAGLWRLLVLCLLLVITIQAFYVPSIVVGKRFRCEDCPKRERRVGFRFHAVGRPRSLFLANSDAGSAAVRIYPSAVARRTSLHQGLALARDMGDIDAFVCTMRQHAQAIAANQPQFVSDSLLDLVDDMVGHVYVKQLPEWMWCLGRLGFKKGLPRHTGILLRSAHKLRELCSDKELFLQRVPMFASGFLEAGLTIADLSADERRVLEKSVAHTARTMKFPNADFPTALDLLSKHESSNKTEPPSRAASTRLLRWRLRRHPAASVSEEGFVPMWMLSIRQHLDLAKNWICIADGHYSPAHLNNGSAVCGGSIVLMNKHSYQSQPIVIVRLIQGEHSLSSSHEAELLSITAAAVLTHRRPIRIFSDCLPAIHAIRKETSGGNYSDHKRIFMQICSQTDAVSRVSHQHGHPERLHVLRSNWTNLKWGMYLADLAASPMFKSVALPAATLPTVVVHVSIDDVIHLLCSRLPWKDQQLLLLMPSDELESMLSSEQRYVVLELIQMLWRRFGITKWMQPEQLAQQLTKHQQQDVSESDLLIPALLQLRNANLQCSSFPPILLSWIEQSVQRWLPGFSDRDAAQVKAALRNLGWASQCHASFG